MKTVVILAAGKGSRMNSNRPKVLHELAGKPMVRWVVDKAKELSPEKIIIVESDNRLVSKYLADSSLEYITQSSPRGTGHALSITDNLINETSSILVLYGDSPLIQKESLTALISNVDNSNAYGGILTAKLKTTSEFGRIIKDAAGNVTDVVQFKDADEETRKIKEVDAGPIYFSSKTFFHHLAKVRPSAVTGEIYLNKVIPLLSAAGHKFIAQNVDPHRVLWGINTQQELEEAEKYLKL